MNLMSVHRVCVSLAALLLIAAAPAYAQGLGSISGTVADLAGAGLAGVTVTLAAVVDSAETPLATATTDLKGSYVFRNVPECRYRLTFMLDGFRTLFLGGGIMTAGFVAHPDVRMEPWCATEKMAVAKLFGHAGDADYFRGTVGSEANANTDDGTLGMICGTVTDSSGAGLAGVTVTLARGAELPSATATTDASGRYRLPYVSEGTYSLTFMLGGFENVARPNVSVTRGFALRLDERMEPRAATAVLRVRGADRPGS
jgi:5-hydroxyisourate hydrolase-like protein (transthyretin family)